MQIKAIVKELVTNAARVSLDLFKIMIPIMILVKVLTELGIIKYLAMPLDPIMKIVGLPAQTGLVFATAILNNLYTAIAVYAALIPEMPVLSVAQVTILCTMMLIAHNLPVEGRIVQNCGVSLIGQIALRIGGAVLCGIIFNLVFSYWGLFAEPSKMLWTAGTADKGIWEWALGEIINLGSIFLIILILMTLMKTLKLLRVTDLLVRLLNPVLRLLGIGGEAATITIIGLTMGLAYGGGLIIHEAKSGRVSQKDVFASTSLMGLSHSLIDDTLLMLLLGSSIYGILWGRLLFSFVVIAVITRLLSRHIEAKAPVAGC